MKEACQWPYRGIHGPLSENSGLGAYLGKNLLWFNYLIHVWFNCFLGPFSVTLSVYKRIGFAPII